MRRLLIIYAFAIAAFAACQPEAYTGPLDSPVGNWTGVRSEYFFNGEEVAAVDVSVCRDGAASVVLC